MPIHYYTSIGDREKVQGLLSEGEDANITPNVSVIVGLYCHW